MMTEQHNRVLNRLSQHQTQTEQRQAQDVLLRLIQPPQYVGEVYSISYEFANVQIHDYHREQVGGIPSLSFLVATRLMVQVEDNGHSPPIPYVEHFDFRREESSVILLRVIDSASLPGDAEAERVRVELAQKVTGENRNWDGSETMDAATHNVLSFAGVRCRVIGTFFIEQVSTNKLALRFGCDLSNYYPNRGLKVYKPNGLALKEIVNYLDPDRLDPVCGDARVAIGQVRYASTNRSFQGVADVSVSIAPADLLGQKTALFGMTRTGKSNTTKVILKSVFGLRYRQKPLRIGQLVFDPNGEYANENVQDNPDKPDAIKNVWKSNSAGLRGDVITYGLSKPIHDPDRKLMLLNFYEEQNLQLGKDILNSALLDIESQFVRNFRQVAFHKPDNKDWRGITRYRRHVLVYRTLLKHAGFDIPQGLTPDTSKLFPKDLRSKMIVSEDATYMAAANVLGKKTPTWDELITALESLARFMRTKDYKEFDMEHVKSKKKSRVGENDTSSLMESDEDTTVSISMLDAADADDQQHYQPEDTELDGEVGETWADTMLKNLLAMFVEQNGASYVARCKGQHTTSIRDDYAREIYNDLCAGKLVIVDQSTGDPDLNRLASERIMWAIFQGHRELFRKGEKTIPDVLVYIEEAHNLLPTGSERKLDNVWVRTAKEGAKYHIGMVYATQEVSSIQANILKNTANWFIGHLNNTDETKELCKYYDFADFEASIRRAQDRGFLRVKTLSNLFVVPIQVRKFSVKEIA